MNELIWKRIATLLVTACLLSPLTGCYSAHTSFESQDADLLLRHSPRHTVLFRSIDLSESRVATYSVRGLPTHDSPTIRVQYSSVLAERVASDPDARFVITIVESESGEKVAELTTGAILDNPEWHNQLLLVPPLGWEQDEKGVVWDASDHSFDYQFLPRGAPNPHVAGAWSDGAGAYTLSLPAYPELSPATAYTLSMRLDADEGIQIDDDTRAYLMYLHSFRW
jgi:hypothetical protein